MNDSIDLQNPGEAARWIDRLVDGDLGDDQQRQLLLALEVQPDGWRRCALAFLESNTWRREFRALALDAGHGESHTIHVSALPHRATSFHPRWLAIAASLLVTFGLGIAAGGMWIDWFPRAGEATQVAQAPSNSVPATTESLAVTIPSADGETERTVQVPLVEASQNSWHTMLAQNSLLLSDELREALERVGHRVQQRRALYPVKLDDGREAVLPVDLVELQYRGGWQ